MHAKLYNSPRNLPDLPRFKVSADHVSPILSALHPCQRDPHPAKWQVLGEIEVKCRGEEERLIYLYWTGYGPGAFSAPPYGYYRGGSDQAIEDAIRAAYRP
jgi:hypothetical protein